MPTPHNNAAKGDFAKTVLMPGDPLRAKFIAETFLTEPKLVNNVRGVQGYTGTYKGVPVSVMASGMGIPSIGIYSYELYTQYDVENIIRVGSAGEGADAATIEGYKALTVTSAMKGLYPATYDTLTDVIVNGNWEKYSAKIDTLGLVSADDPAANYVQIPLESTQWADGAFTQDDYKALVKAMFDGTLTVSNDITKAASDFATVITVEDLGNIK